MPELEIIPSSWAVNRSHPIDTYQPTLIREAAGFPET
jgi:hypothetical protein